MNSALLEKIIADPSLPTLPAAAIKIVDMCRRDDVPVRQIADTISHDPALAVKILKTVNSGYYNLSHRVTTISHALVLLGLDAVRTLALGFSLVKALRDVEGDDYDPSPIWRRSLYAAITARTIAQRIGSEEHEEAFLAGLLQDLGILAFIQALGSVYVTLLKDAERQGRELWQVEREQLGLDHTHLGEALAKRWNLPGALTAPIRFHEEPWKASAPCRQRVLAVALGNKAALPFLSQSGPNVVGEYLTAASDWFGLDQKSATSILEKTSHAAPAMASMFEIPGDAPINLATILQQGNDAMVELSMKSRRQVQEIQQTAAELHKQASHDALTGVHNRGWFLEYFPRAFCAARRMGDCLSLVMLDLDHFKQINDTQGHPIGDRVLRAVAQVAREGAGSEDLIARFGGEEFILLLRGWPADAALTLADRIRAQIAARSFEMENGTPLQVTASFGVATLTMRSDFAGPEAMVSAAAAALHAAKGAGRNCVRAHVPVGNP